MSRPVTGLSPQTAVSHPRPPLGMTGAALAAREVGYGRYVSLAAIALPVVATAHPLRVRSILVPLVPLGAPHSNVTPSRSMRRKTRVRRR